MQKYEDEPLAQFNRQLNLIYASGIILTEGLKMMEMDFKIIDIPSLILNTETEGHLSLALAKDKAFPIEMVEAYKAAEAVGKEDKISLHLSHYYTNQAQSKRFLKEALLMPLILLSILILVIGVLSFVVLPVFLNVFEQLGSLNNGWMISLVYFAQGMSIFGLILLALIALTLIVVQFKHVFQQKESVLDFALRLFPSSKYLYEVARFSYITQIILEGALDSQTAMNILLAQIPRGKLRQQLLLVKDKLKPNEGIYELLNQIHIYPPLIQNTIQIGIKTGQLESVMESVFLQMQSEAEE
ncbi:MAG: hypothetical protein WCI62_02880, partial [Erysipelotrichaceae bacterium]